MRVGSLLGTLNTVLYMNEELINKCVGTCRLTCSSGGVEESAGPGREDAVVHRLTGCCRNSSNLGYKRFTVLISRQSGARLGMTHSTTLYP